MASLAIFVAVAIALVATSQVYADYTREECWEKYHIPEYVWNMIKAAKEMEGSLSIDNCAVDGDELLTRQLAKEMWDDVHDRWGHRSKRKVIDFEKYHPDAKWIERHLYYYIDDEFDSDEVNNIQDALDYISSVTCFSFSEVDDTEDALVHFSQDESCLTFMGRVPDDQLPHEIYLNAGCAGRVGEIVHQIGHMLGLWHEHQRPDRDDYVTINPDNIKSGETGNYMVFDDLIDTLDMPYDYTSIMHYPSTQFARVDDEVLHTMEASDQTPENLREWVRRTIGQRVELSFYDKKIINQVYCEDSCPSNQQSCRNNGYRNPRRCSECVCPDGFGGNTCNLEGVYNSEAGCGGQVRTDSSEVKFVSTPGYGESAYERGTVCSWFVQAPSGKRIELEFEDDFGVFARGAGETCYHWVEIRTGDDLTNPGTRFCGQNRPDLTLTSDTNEVMVVFKSLYPADEEDMQGFKLSIREVDACSDNLCENGGSCVLDESEEPGYICRCTEGFEGDRCSDSIEGGCPCENGGVCRDSDEYDYCFCPYGFEGEFCEHGCGLCPTPERTYDKQEYEPCEGYREAEKEVCVTRTESYNHRWWGRRRTRYRTVKDCHMEDDTGYGAFCGCGWELYENEDGDLKCAMTGYGKYGECECFGSECRRDRWHYRVVSEGHWGYWWWCGTYIREWLEYQDCPDDECNEDCYDSHHGWGWSWRRR